MTGRVSILLVAGLSLLLIILNLGKNTNESVENLVTYENRSNAYTIAKSGFNLAATSLYFDNTAGNLASFDAGRWSHFRNNVDFEGGRLTVSVTLDGDKIKCFSEGTYPANGPHQQSIAFVSYLGQGFFDQHVVLTDNDPGSIPWTTYDTANGNLHSNNTLLIDHYAGNPVMPVFNGTVTTTNPATITAGTVPVFTQGPPRSGVTIPFPSSLPQPPDPLFQPGGPGPDWNQKYMINNGENLDSHSQLHLQFFIDGSGDQKVRYFTDVRLTNRGNGNQSSNGTGYYGDFRATDPVISPPADGIIRTAGVDVFIEGTIKGKISILSDSSGVSGGNIFLTDDLICNINPRFDRASGDYIGLLAYRNVIIGNTAQNRGNNGSNVFTVDASIFALTGGVTSADNQNRNRQRLEIFGSITQRIRKGVGSGSNAIGATSGGFMKGYRYDPRLRSQHALLMPGTPLMVLESYLARTM